MRISKDQIPAKINVPGAIARVATEFGDATGFGKMEESTSPSAPGPTLRRY